MRIGVSICLLVMAASACPQGLVSVSSSATLSEETVRAKIKKVFKGQASGGAAVRLFRTRYKSRDVNGQTTTVSGLVAIPSDGAPKGLVVWYHGTLANRDNVPSRYRGEEANAESEAPVIALASSGYAVALPDYLGLGDHKGFHPLPLSSVNAWSGIDLIPTARQIASDKGLIIGPNLFVSGYSQGGSVAMAAARQLQEMGIPVKKAAPLSGPYDFTGAQARQILEKSTNPITVGGRVFLASYLALGMKRNGIALDMQRYFVPSFASYVPTVFDQNLPDKQLIQKLLGKALQLGSFRSLDRITQPKFRQALRDGDQSDPLIRTLHENNSYDWSPQMPMYLVCVKGDQIVSDGNTLMAVRSMRKRGVGRNGIRFHRIPTKGLNHLTGFPPAVLLARRFFDSGFGAVPSDD